MIFFYIQKYVFFFSQHFFDRLPLVVMLNKRDLFEARLKGKSEGKFHHYVKSCPRDVAKKGFKDVHRWLLREVLENEGSDGDPETGLGYVPNGREVDHDHYRYKLDWLGRLHDDLAANTSPADQSVVVVGDFNVAPDDRDVWDPKELEGSTHVTEPERQALGRLVALGFVDVFRERFDSGGLYSWWDYRRLGFQRNDGLRIDFVLATQPLVKKLQKAWIDRDERKGDKPSDHVPVVAEFDFKLS